MKSNQVKKGNKKQFKYEMIELIILTLLNINCITSHIIRNGLQLDKIMFEIIIYFTITFMFYYLIKDIRKNPNQWNLKELFK